MHVWIIKKRSIIRVLIFMLLVGVTFVYANSISNKDSKVSSENPVQMPIRSIESETQIALTFDTAFGDDYTAEILKILDENNVKATFFVMGSWAIKYPASINLITLSGHEIASHSMSHTRYTDITPEDMIADARAMKDYLYRTCDVETNLIRLPYGAYDDNAIYNLTTEGFVPVTWSVDSKDWKAQGAEAIISTIKKQAKPGDIVMFQINSPDTVEALDEVIKAIVEKGMEPTVVSDMIPTGKVYIDSNGELKKYKD